MSRAKAKEHKRMTYFCAYGVKDRFERKYVILKPGHTDGHLDDCIRRHEKKIQSYGYTINKQCNEATYYNLSWLELPDKIARRLSLLYERILINVCKLLLDLGFERLPNTNEYFICSI